jgi:hypothetical protein
MTFSPQGADVTRRIARAAGGLAAAGLALMLATACSHHPTATTAAGPSPSQAEPGAPTSAPGDPGSTGAPSAAPSGGGAGGGGGNGGVVSGNPTTRLCKAGDLAMTQQPGGDAAGGKVVVAIALTNKSGSDCSIEGFPVFTLAGAGGTESVTVQHDGKGIPAFKIPAPPVNLKPGAKAGFLVLFLNRPTTGAGSCSAATTMNLSVGGGRISGPVQISLCGSPLNVSPYVPSSALAAA